MIAAFTGHRPNKLGGYKPSKKSRWIQWRIEEELASLSPSKVISGMALGVDQWAARISIKLGIPLIAAIPFEGQESLWPTMVQADYHSLLNRAAEIKIVCRGAYSPEKMQRRNEWMVNECDCLIAVWDGSSGGTSNCVRYARLVGIEIVYISDF